MRKSIRRIKYWLDELSIKLKTPNYRDVYFRLPNEALITILKLLNPQIFTFDITDSCVDFTTLEPLLPYLTGMFYSGYLLKF